MAGSYHLIFDYGQTGYIKCFDDHQLQYAGIIIDVPMTFYLFLFSDTLFLIIVPLELNSLNLPFIKVRIGANFPDYDYIHSESRVGHLSFYFLKTI